MIVSITLGFTLVLATGYLAAVILSDGAILLRPSQQALERHESYNELIQPASDDLTGKGIVACIVDSGIAIEHPDLEGVNLVGWRDFINGNGNPYDDHGHGTSMAGLLVANGWLKGMAQDVDLLVAKALGEDGSGSDAIVADAVDWCAENGAHVISLSLGGAPNILPFSIGSGRSSGDAASEAIDAGIYVVAAAGNDGEDDDGDVAHPSSEAGVISVGGVTLKGTHWPGSSKGDNNGRLLPLPILMPRGDPNKKPEIVAPAEAVPVLLDDGGWGLADGTSAATVYVTGALCLLLQEKPSLKADESSGGSDNINAVKQWMMESAIPEEGQVTHDDYYGYGLLNVAGLIQEATQA
jgi:serine protease AprX